MTTDTTFFRVMVKSAEFARIIKPEPTAIVQSQDKMNVLWPPLLVLNQHESATHPQMDGHGGSIIQRKQNILAPAPNGADTPARHFAYKCAWLKPMNKTGPIDNNAIDARPHKAGSVQIINDDLDFRQFGHKRHLPGKHSPLSRR
jgi:hypothetical protein